MLSMGLCNVPTLSIMNSRLVKKLSGSEVGRRSPAMSARHVISIPSSSVTIPDEAITPTHSLSHL